MHNWAKCSLFDWIEAYAQGERYVVVAATPVQFPATVETIIVPKTLYKVTVSFGDNTIYLDLKDGKSAMSRTLDGVPQILKERKVIEDYEVQLLVTLIIFDV